MAHEGGYAGVGPKVGVEEGGMVQGHEADEKGYREEGDHHWQVARRHASTRDEDETQGEAGSAAEEERLRHPGQESVGEPGIREQAVDREEREGTGGEERGAQTQAGSCQEQTEEGHYYRWPKTRRATKPEPTGGS